MSERCPEWLAKRWNGWLGSKKHCMVDRLNHRRSHWDIVWMIAWRMYLCILLWLFDHFPEPSLSCSLPIWAVSSLRCPTFFWATLATRFLAGDFKPIEKYEFVSWYDDYSQVWTNKTCAINHQHHYWSLLITITPLCIHHYTTINH